MYVYKCSYEALDSDEESDESAAEVCTLYMYNIETRIPLFSEFMAKFVHYAITCMYIYTCTCTMYIHMDMWTRGSWYSVQSSDDVHICMHIHSLYGVHKLMVVCDDRMKMRRRKKAKARTLTPAILETTSRRPRPPWTMSTARRRAPCRTTTA